MVRWKLQTSSQCPCCFQDSEDTPYIIGCQEPVTWQLWSSSLKAIWVWLWEKNTNPKLMDTHNHCWASTIAMPTPGISATPLMHRHSRSNGHWMAICFEWLNGKILVWLPGGHLETCLIMEIQYAMDSIFDQELHGEYWNGALHNSEQAHQQISEHHINDSISAYNARGRQIPSWCHANAMTSSGIATTITIGCQTTMVRIDWTINKQQNHTFLSWHFSQCTRYQTYGIFV